jgi:hypothetical protein
MQRKDGNYDKLEDSIVLQTVPCPYNRLHYHTLKWAGNMVESLSYQYRF